MGGFFWVPLLALDQSRPERSSMLKRVWFCEGKQFASSVVKTSLGA